MEQPDNRHLSIVQAVNHLIPTEAFVHRDETSARVVRGADTYKSIAGTLTNLGLGYVFQSEYRLPELLDDEILAAAIFVSDPDKNLGDLDEDDRKEWTSDLEQFNVAIERIRAITAEHAGKVAIDCYEAYFHDHRLAFYVEMEWHKELVRQTETALELVTLWEDIWEGVQDGREEQNLARLQAAVDALEDDADFRSLTLQRQQTAYAMERVPGLKDLGQVKARDMVVALTDRLKLRK